jgi:hypothetical protein
MGALAEIYEVAMSNYYISIIHMFRKSETYPDDDRKPDLSSNEEVGSMTEERLDDGRVEGIKERSRGEFPSRSA